MPKYPEITSKKIKYDSPSGYVNIGKYIPPFENNKSGYGFMGVIAEDSVSGKLQCSLCGKWFEQLPTHLNLSHDGMTGFEYRQMFGLLQSTALKSKRIRLNQSKVMQKLRKKNPQNRLKFKPRNTQAGNRKGIKKALESQNKYGVCELQLMHKISELAKELGKTPTLTQIKDRYGGVTVTNMHLRFGSYVAKCRAMNLEPGTSNYNPKYSRRYFIEKALSNEPSVRIFTLTERRQLYQYGLSIAQLKKMCEAHK